MSSIRHKIRKPEADSRALVKSGIMKRIRLVTHGGENCVALVTALLILLLLSTMIAGFSWMVMSDRALGGNYQDRQLAFYGAEAGMESLTAALENLFNANYAPTNAMITGTSGIVATAPSNLVPGVQYRSEERRVGKGC